mmetsp:Transcript_34382/g.107484  ORF Transcript_34382/g.107484 Transcript_34382/m.107484 type:complete len:237 (+) Transcript_34382:209-919(+)
MARPPRVVAPSARGPGARDAGEAQRLSSGGGCAWATGARGRGGGGSTACTGAERGRRAPAGSAPERLRSVLQAAAAGGAAAEAAAAHGRPRRWRQRARGQPRGVPWPHARVALRDGLVPQATWWSPAAAGAILPAGVRAPEPPAPPASARGPCLTVPREVSGLPGVVRPAGAARRGEGPGHISGRGARRGSGRARVCEAHEARAPGTPGSERCFELPGSHCPWSPRTHGADLRHPG